MRDITVIQKEIKIISGVILRSMEQYHETKVELYRECFIELAKQRDILIKELREVEHGGVNKKINKLQEQAGSY